MTNLVPTHTPVSATERIRELDIVRGFALFGVLLVNITMFVPPNALSSGSILSNPLTLPFPNNIAAFLIDVFGVGNFYTIFSFLFGLGFYIFMERAEMRGRLGRSLYYRRTLLLFLMGALHFLFVWRGDILHTYGFVGLLLLYFWKSEPKAVLKWAVALLLIWTVFISGMTHLNSLPRVQSEKEAENFRHWIKSRYKEAEAAYVFGSFSDVVSYRIKNEISQEIANTIFAAPKILGMFLIGFYVGKSKIAKSIATNLTLIKRIWQTTACLGAITLAMYVSTRYHTFVMPYWRYGAQVFFKEASTVFMSLFYISSLVMLYHKKPAYRVFTYLASLGRMALTNYLVQCMLCSLLLYGYGLGLMPSALEMVAMALVIYIAQALLSSAWLQKYTYGPFEYLWRKLTYGTAI